MKQITKVDGKVGYINVVQNRTDASSDSELLMESFSDDEDCEAIDTENNSKTENLTNSKNAIFSNESIDIDSNFNKNDSAAEIRKLLRRKDELERKQKMQDKFDERFKVSRSVVFYHLNRIKINQIHFCGSFKSSIKRKLSDLRFFFDREIKF